MFKIHFKLPETSFAGNSMPFVLAKTRKKSTIQNPLLSNNHKMRLNLLTLLSDFTTIFLHIECESVSHLVGFCTLLCNTTFFPFFVVIFLSASFTVFAVNSDVCRYCLFRFVYCQIKVNLNDYLFQPCCCYSSLSTSLLYFSECNNLSLFCGMRFDFFLLLSSFNFIPIFTFQCNKFLRLEIFYSS